MSNIMISESICLSSEDNPAESPAEQITHHCLEQKSRLRGYEARYRIFNEHYIEVETRGMFRRPCHYEVDCAFLDPRPRQVLRVDWWSAGVSLVLFASLAALAWRAPALPVTGTALTVGFGLLLVASTFSLGLCLFRTTDRVLFYTAHGRMPLLKLLNRKPTPGQLQAFVTDVTKRIEAIREAQAGKEEYLSAELREHRRLKDEGILSDDAYEVVKKRLLRAHGSH